MANICGYCSRTTTKAEETTASVTELELASIVLSIRVWRHLLYAKKRFRIFSDHHALVYLMNSATQPPTRKVANFLAIISEFSFDLHHIRGDSNPFRTSA